jgi:hypothetical protein
MASIGAVRHVWNVIWLPMLQAAGTSGREHAKANGETPEAWKAAWKLHPDPTETAYSHARKAAQAPGAGREWISEALQTPFYRAARSFVDAVKASRGRRAMAKRKARLGRVSPVRRDDCRQGLEGSCRAVRHWAGVSWRTLSRLASSTCPCSALWKFQDKRQLSAYRPQASKLAK